MTHTEKRILMTLQRRWRFGDGGNCWKSFKDLACEINRSLVETKKAIHSLRDQGVVAYSVLTTDECIPHGSGYLLKGEWNV